MRQASWFCGVDSLADLRVHVTSQFLISWTGPPDQRTDHENCGFLTGGLILWLTVQSNVTTLLSASHHLTRSVGRVHRTNALIMVLVYPPLWFDSLAALVSPMSPLASCMVVVLLWFDTLADPFSPMSPLFFASTSGLRLDGMPKALAPWGRPKWTGAVCP